MAHRDISVCMCVSRSVSWPIETIGISVTAQPAVFHVELLMNGSIFWDAVFGTSYIHVLAISWLKKIFGVTGVNGVNTPGVRVILQKNRFHCFFNNFWTTQYFLMRFFANESWWNFLSNGTIPLFLKMNPKGSKIAPKLKFCIFGPFFTDSL